MNKKELTEADIRTKFITPALLAPGGRWDLMTQLREEIYFTKGRVLVRGKTVKRGEAKKADYLLDHKPTFRSLSGGRFQRSRLSKRAIATLRSDVIQSKTAVAHARSSLV